MVWCGYGVGHDLFFSYFNVCFHIHFTSKHKENKNVLLHGCAQAMSQLLKRFVVKLIVCMFVSFVLPIPEAQRE